MCNNASLKKKTQREYRTIFCCRMKVIQLDVTSKKQIEDALGYITEQLNGKGIDRIKDILARYEYNEWNLTQI